MSDTSHPAVARPMTADDYSQGNPVPQAPGADHPTRDLLIGAVVGAVALWAVPKALDYLVGGMFAGDEEDELELEADDG